MKIKVKQIYVLKKVSAENGTYTYQKAIISANQIMTLSELKERQKQAAIDFNVHQNKIGGIYENLEFKLTTKKLKNYGKHRASN